MATKTDQKTKYRNKMDKIKDICKECIKEIVRMRTLKENQNGKS